MDRETVLELLSGRAPGRQQLKSWLESGGKLPSLAGAKLPAFKFEGLCLAGADLQDCFITDAFLTNAQLAGADLRGAHFNGAIGNNADFRHARLDNAKMSNVHLSGCNFTTANMCNAQITDAEFTDSVFDEASLCSAVLSNCKFDGCSFRNSVLMQATLEQCKFANANLQGIDLNHSRITNCAFVGANLTNLNLCAAHLIDSNLSKATIRDSWIGDAYIRNCRFDGADLHGAKLTALRISRTDLSQALHLDATVHRGPSELDLESLRLAKGMLDTQFLRDIGLSDWEIDFAQLYDPSLSANEIADRLTTKVFSHRTTGPILIQGALISYSHVDAEFAERLRGSLFDNGIHAWMDKFDMVAGKTESQVHHQIRLRDVVVVVLSKHSLESDWVWTEIEWAVEKERAENRVILCPVAVDPEWKSYEQNAVLFRRLKEKHILDFSDWRTGGFDREFGKLVAGLKQNYG